MKLRPSVGALLTAGLVTATVAAGPTALAAQSGAPAPRSAPVPAARVAPAAAGTPVHVWASDVNVRHDPADANCWFHPSRSCPVVTVVSRVTVTADCQREGESVQDSGYSNRWWSYVRTPSGHWGWINNIYLQGGEKIAGVPDCAF